jgi:hypothetical protein
MFSRCRNRNRIRDWRLSSVEADTAHGRSGFCEWISRLTLQLVTLAVLFSTVGISSSAERELRVCADPNNLPFSNQLGEGFENRIADLMPGSWAQNLIILGGPSDVALCAILCARVRAI